MRNKLIRGRNGFPFVHRLVALNRAISARSSHLLSPKFVALIGRVALDLVAVKRSSRLLVHSLSASNSLIDSQVVLIIDIHSVYTHGAKILANSSTSIRSRMQ